MVRMSHSNCNFELVYVYNILNAHSETTYCSCCTTSHPNINRYLRMHRNRTSNISKNVATIVTQEPMSARLDTVTTFQVIEVRLDSGWLALQVRYLVSALDKLYLSVLFMKILNGIVRTKFYINKNIIVNLMSSRKLNNNQILAFSVYASGVFKWWTYI